MQTNNKLREALEYVIQWREDCVDEEGADNVDDMMAVVNAALAEPIRNCDRFNTGDVKQDAQDAMEAILDEGVAGYRGIAEYLLSPVRTEQKGEDDGSK